MTQTLEEKIERMFWGLPKLYWLNEEDELVPAELLIKKEIESLCKEVEREVCERLSNELSVTKNLDEKTIRGMELSELLVLQTKMNAVDLIRTLYLSNQEDKQEYDPNNKS